MGVWSLRSSICLSLAVHTLVLLACTVLLIMRPADMDPSRLTWVEIAPRSAQKPKQKEESTRKQVVVTERGFAVDEAVPDSFLGERNQVVTEQTVGKTQRLSGRVQTPRPAAANPGVKTLTKNPISQDEVSSQKLGSFGIPIINHLKDVAKDQELPDTDRPWADEGERFQDYVKGIKEGNRTALNTKEYVFFGYFQRIRERLDRAWVPILRERLVKYHYSGRTLASDMNHSTKVLVVLNPHGEIIKVQVLSESGTRDLDDAAVRAFNEAGPFPNPPQGIVDKNGEIQIPWEFILRT